MDDNMLDWAGVICVKTSTAGPEETLIENRYMIALDISDYNQRFVCPCCGTQLFAQVGKRTPLSSEQKRSVIRDKRKESWEGLKTFAGVSVFLLAAVIAWLFTDGFVTTALTWIVFLVFAFIWLPGFILMARDAFLLRSRRRIIKSYEKKLPAAEIWLKGDMPGTQHYFTYIPDFIEDEALLS